MEEGWAGKSPVLAERDHELRALTEAAADADRSGARLVVITGEAGAGKSRLVAEFVATLPAGWSVVRILPSELLDPSGDPAASMAALSRSLGERVAGRLGESTRGGNVAAIVEDLHAFEPVVILALGEAVQALRHHPVLIVATYRFGSYRRGDPYLRALAELLRRPAAHELRLAPLSPAGVATMVRAMGGEAGEATTAALHRRTGGNPFFVEQLLHAPDASVPTTVSDAVRSTLAPLGAGAVRVAAALAIARRPLPFTVLGDLVPEAAAAVAALVDAGFAVEHEGASVRLRHTLLGETIEGLDDWRALHHQLAEVLERGPGTPADELARHWAAAGEHARAAPWALVAAERALARHAYRAAVDLFALVLDSPPADPVEHASVLRRAAGSAALAGESDLAVAWGSAAQDAYRAAGLPAESDRVWDDPGLRYLPNPTTVAARGVDVDAGSDSETVARLWEEVRRGEEAGDREVVAEAALVLFMHGEVDAGRQLTEALVEQAIAQRDAVEASRRLGNLARMAGALGHVDRASGHYRRALAEARREPESRYWLIAQAALALFLARCGDLDEAEALAQEIAVPAHGLLAGYGDLPLAVVEMERGGLDCARPRVEGLVPLAAATGQGFLLLPVLAVQARLELNAGNLQQAREVLARAWSVASDQLYEERTDLLVLSARAAAEGGALAELEAVVEDAAELARTMTAGPAVHAAADAVQGWLARVTGRTAEASTHFQAAARAWERAGRWTLAAEAWCEAAASDSGSGGGGVEAAAALDRAEHIARRRRLEPVLQRIEVLKEERRRRGAPTGAELIGLSEREIAILRLVAVGATNAEIAGRLYISESTTAHHLTSIFAKLGVSRRTEAAAVAVRSGLFP